EAQEKKIWEHAWKDQESLFTWPDGIPQEQLDVLNKLRFYDSIDSTIRTTYADGRYKSQVNELYAVVQPKVVQLGAGLRWVSQWASLPPTSEDMWLAQEDLWVQHGLLQIIRDTNDLLAALKVEKTVNERQKVFSNANWVLELTLAPVNGKPGIKYKLHNNSKRRQVLPVTFQVEYASVKDLLEVQGEPLAPGKSISGERALEVQFSSARELTSARQQFDWRTVPVKRVDQIVMAQNSSRTAQSPLKPPLRFKAPEAAAGGDETRPSSSDDAPMPGRPGASGATGRPDVSMTENKLYRNRYIECSEQVRRMPVALAVVIDQAHMQDLLAAVANSPLRIQTTQWHWSRFHGDIKPVDLESSPDGTPGPPVVGGKAPAAPPTLSRPPSSERDDVDPGKGRPAFMGAPRPGQGFFPGREVFSSASTAVADEQEWDLVELAIYGIASLYERYP